VTLKLSKNFDLGEFVHSNTAEILKIANTPDADSIAALTNLTVQIIQPLRDAIGKPIKISSGYRSAELNVAVGSSPDKDGIPQSQHRRGEAADIIVEAMTPEEVILKLLVLELPFDQAIAEHDYDKGDHWTHLSYTTRRPNRKETKHIIIEKGIKTTLPFVYVSANE
jgi:hypothetical protein